MMMYLLQNCSLFVKLDQDCLLQVTGVDLCIKFCDWICKDLLQMPDQPEHSGLVK